MSSSRSAIVQLGVSVSLGILIILGATVISSKQEVSATPEHAAQTHLACGACHVSPAGGGKLTARGQRFQKTRK
jgi:hypothetical protein